MRPKSRRSMICFKSLPKGRDFDKCKVLEKNTLAPVGERGRFFDKRLAAPTLHLSKHIIPLFLIQIENAALRIRKKTGREGTVLIHF